MSLIPGNFDSGNHYSTTVIFCTSINCRRYTAVIAGSIAGGFIAIASLLICITYCYCRCRRRPSQANITFVNTINHKTTKYTFCDINLFKSGIWSSRYLQFGIWHGPIYFSLLFDSQLLKVTGSGSDDIGRFTIDGIYSNKTGRIGLMKTYRFDSTTRIEHLDHQIIIQLIWNSEMRQFEGTRYVRTKTYREENKFELKFNKQQRISPNERV
jgi:hypothetical protein